MLVMAASPAPSFLVDLLLPTSDPLSSSSTLSPPYPPSLLIIHSISPLISLQSHPFRLFSAFEVNNHIVDSSFLFKSLLSLILSTNTSFSVSVFAVQSEACYLSCDTMCEETEMTDFHGLAQIQPKQPHVNYSPFPLLSPYLAAKTNPYQIDPRHLEAATRRIPVRNSMAKKFISVCEVVGSEASIKTSVGIFIGLRIILIEAFNSTSETLVMDLWSAGLSLA